jgi:hypothetical protein
LELPWLVMMRTGTTPASCAGARTTSLRPLLARTSVAWADPKSTRLTPVRLRPLMTTSVPPTVVPVWGASFFTEGLGAGARRSGWWGVPVTAIRVASPVGAGVARLGATGAIASASASRPLRLAAAPVRLTWRG